MCLHASSGAVAETPCRPCAFCASIPHPDGRRRRRRSGCPRRRSHARMARCPARLGTSNGFATRRRATLPASQVPLAWLFAPEGLTACGWQPVRDRDRFVKSGAQLLLSCLVWLARAWHGLATGGDACLVRHILTDVKWACDQQLCRYTRRTKCAPHTSLRRRRYSLARSSTHSALSGPGFAASISAGSMMPATTTM